MTPYDFLVDTYETEIVKVVSVWSMFDDDAMALRPHNDDVRGRSLLEQMVHQCVSENLWFSTMFGIHITDNPLPEPETRIGFIEHYARDATARLVSLNKKDESWWTAETDFFDSRRPRTWIITRRIAHTAHHRGQQTAMLRMISAAVHSTYGPTADTGGLMQNHAPVAYAYPSIEELLQEESSGRRKAMLPGPGNNPPTERP